MGFDNVKKGIFVAVIVLVAATCVAGGVVLIANHFTNNTPVDNIVDSSESQSSEPTPTKAPDVEQQVVIDQDRTLKFDNIVNSVIGKESGVAAITVEEYGNTVDGMVELRRVKRYDETEGFTCRNTEMFRIEGWASEVVSKIDGSVVRVEEIYLMDSTYDSYVSERLSGYSELMAHESEWQLPFKVYKTEDVPVTLPSWTWREDNIAQLTGIGHADFSELKYEDALFIMEYYNVGVHTCTCYLKVNDHRFLKITSDASPVNQIGYITELIQNCLVVF